MKFESQEKGEAEALKERLSELKGEAGRLEKLILDTGENADAELGSNEYVDFGYTEQLQEVNEEIGRIEQKLQDLDDAAGAQRNLNI